MAGQVDRARNVVIKLRLFKYTSKFLCGTSYRVQAVSAYIFIVALATIRCGEAKLKTGMRKSKICMAFKSRKEAIGRFEC